MRSILITTGGGLGNRLLGLASAMVLAKRHDAVLQVCWTQGGPKQTGTSEGFFGNFESLYHPCCEFVSVETRDCILQQQHRHYSLEDQRNTCPVADTGLTYYYTHGAIRNTATHEELKTAVLGLKPRSAVRDCIATAKILLDDRIYDGLLVRCHGHPKARRWQPGFRFQQFLRTRPKTECFYMACDNRDAASRLQSIGHRVVLLPRQWKRNSPGELVTVAADIHMLAASERFYATPHCALAELVRILRDDRQSPFPEEQLQGAELNLPCR